MHSGKKNPILAFPKELYFTIKCRSDSLLPSRSIFLRRVTNALLGMTICPPLRGQCHANPLACLQHTASLTSPCARLLAKTLHFLLTVAKMMKVFTILLNFHPYLFCVCLCVCARTHSQLPCLLLHCLNQSGEVNVLSDLKFIFSIS